MTIRYVDDSGVQLEGKRVFCRVDFNVPMEGRTITDDERITAAIPTINMLREKGARILLASHLGRPKKREPGSSLEPVGARLAELLKTEVNFIDDCIGDGVRKLAGQLKNGQVLLLENLRFHPEEEKDDDNFAKALAQNADVYVNDAFGAAHRAHASVHAITHHLTDRYAGLLMRKEVESLSRVTTNPQKPFVAVLGGAKVSDKIAVINQLMNKVDKLMIGGAMAYTFLKAAGLEVGASRVEEDRLKLAEQILKNAKEKHIELLLPTDHVVAEKFDENAPPTTVEGNIPAGQMGLDIGPKTRARYAEALKGARTVFWNGPQGVFEWKNYAEGTLAVARAVADATGAGAFTVVGGGDSVSAAKTAGVEKKISHISTGGGASLELIEGKELPGIKALDR
ncbi:MAG: phosphoglycerate kinase [Myxococcota bacterium]